MLYSVQILSAKCLSFCTAKCVFCTNEDLQLPDLLFVRLCSFPSLDPFQFHAPRLFPVGRILHYCDWFWLERETSCVSPIQKYPSLQLQCRQRVSALCLLCPQLHWAYYLNIPLHLIGYTSFKFLSWFSWVNRLHEGKNGVI